MVFQTLNDQTGEQVGTGIYSNKNTLTKKLPSLVDLTLYDFVNKSTSDNINNLLLDFSAAERLCDSGIAALISLQKLAWDTHLSLFMLDMPDDMRDQLVSMLSGAFWIESPAKVSKTTTVRRRNRPRGVGENGAE